jgi:hypothetical protein
LVQKNTAEWRLCVDYMDLNRHCLKDPYGLPHIDWIIDSTAGSALLSFLDCYLGYHQIALREEDKAKPLSSHRLVPTATKPCRLDWRILVLLIRGPSKHA